MEPGAVMGAGIGVLAIIILIVVVRSIRIT
jgi:hypothetical protein